MNSKSIGFDFLFNADGYYRQGHCPWTYYSCSSGKADEHGLPQDNDAFDLLGRIEELGVDVDVAVWINGIAEDMTYVVCRDDDIQRLKDVFKALEDSGEVEKRYCNQRTGRLFATSENHTELGREPERPIARDLNLPSFGGRVVTAVVCLGVCWC